MSDTPTPTAPPSSSSFWQRRIVHPIIQQLTQGISPEKIALTLAVGSALALFPIVGTTTLLCLLIGISLKLNQAIIQVVNGVCTPLHIPVIWMLIRLGEWIFSVPHTRLSLRFMSQLFWDEPGAFFHRFGTTALHAIIAWALLMPFWIAAVYFIARPVLAELKRLRAASAVKTDDTEPPVHPVP